MNEHDIFGIVAFAIACVVIAAYVWWKNKNKPVIPQPTTWIHIGVPPINTDVALRVIKEQLPLWTGRYGGTIEWVKGPFLLDYTLAAGGVLEFNEPRIMLMYDQDVTKTAIVHEIFHVYQMVYNKNKILDGNPELYKFVAETNAKIRAAVV